MLTTIWRRGRDPAGAALVAECEAFLSGRFAEHLLEMSNPVPAWAWTNLLAHGTEEQLRRPPSELGGCWYSGLEAWYQARSYLAGEVLDLAHRHGPLSTLQAAVLIPLELELSSRSESRLWQPGDWVTAVLAALKPVTKRQHSRRRS